MLDKSPMYCFLQSDEVIAECAVWMWSYVCALTKLFGSLLWYDEDSNIVAYVLEEYDIR